MRKFAAMLVALCLLFSFCAFGESRPVLIATTFPLYDIARSIAGEELSVVYMPENAVEKAADADILFIPGGSGDEWALAMENKLVIQALNGVISIDGDEYAFTIPVNLMIAASYFTDALSEMDRENAEIYQTHFLEYAETMSGIDLIYRNAVSQDTVIRCEDGSMAYFVMEYGVKLSDGAENAVELSTFQMVEADRLALTLGDMMLENAAKLVESKN